MIKFMSQGAVEREGTLVLVVDDHPINRLVLMRQVTLLGYATETANDGREALEKWKSGRFTAVITDCDMPEMTGYELARTIREMEPHRGDKRTLIIACTANALRGEVENCFAAGMDDYIAKPVETAKLLAKLDYWIPISGRTGAVHSPIETRILDEISGGRADIRTEALQQFQAFNGEDAKALTNALEVRDIASVTRMAHRITGASATIGATALAAACHALELAARANDWDAIMAHQDAVYRELSRARADIQALLGEAQKNLAS